MLGNYTFNITVVDEEDIRNTIVEEMLLQVIEPIEEPDSDAELLSFANETSTLDFQLAPGESQNYTLPPVIKNQDSYSNYSLQLSPIGSLSLPGFLTLEY